MFLRLCSQCYDDKMPVFSDDICILYNLLPSEIQSCKRCCAWARCRGSPWPPPASPRGCWQPRPHSQPGRARTSPSTGTRWAIRRSLGGHYRHNCQVDKTVDKERESFIKHKEMFKTDQDPVRHRPHQRRQYVVSQVGTGCVRCIVLL